MRGVLPPGNAQMARDFYAEMLWSKLSLNLQSSGQIVPRVKIIEW